MAVVENIERVYPTRTELEQKSQTNVECPVVGCSKIFRQPSALSFHLVKLHKLISNDGYARLAQRPGSQSKSRYEFYCPELSCRYSGGHEQKFFQSYKKLKQHFMRLHTERTLVCPFCDEKFGLSYDLAYHVRRCRQKPWCESCRLCLGSWENLAQHLTETGHRGVTIGQASEDGNNAETPDEAFGATSTNEFSDATSIGEVLTAGHTPALQDSSCGTETRIRETVEESDERTRASGELRENVIPSEVLSDLPAQSGSRFEDATDQAGSKTVVSRSKDDVGPVSRKKRIRLRRSEQDATPRTILPAPNFVVIPSPVATLFFYAEPAVHQSKLQRLAPRPDPSGSSRGSPVAEGCHAAVDGHKRDAWMVDSTHDSESLDAARELVSASTQTRSRKIKAVETQTTEGYVVKKTLSRQSCGSQVSPRARMKRHSVQSTETQTSRSLARKNKQSIAMQTTQETPVSSAVSRLPHDTTVWPDFVHNETQTMELLQQLQESFAESSATQTLESYLFDNFPNESCIGTPSVEACSNTCSTLDLLPDSVYSTMSAGGSDLFGSVGALPNVEEPLKQGMSGENISSATESDYGMFSSAFANIVGGERTGSSFLIHDEMFVEGDFRSSVATSSAAGCNDDLLTRQKTFTAETQTIHPDCLTDFLTSASQTTDFDDMMSINTETQTVDDDLFARFWSHMETQTTEEFLTEFGFSDIETQTTSVFVEDVLPLEVAPGVPTQEPQSAAVLLDMETQTCFQ